MRIVITKETPYEPQKGDGQRCVGQLRIKHPRKVVRFSPDEGVTDKTEPGPRIFVFPVGAKPEVSEELAERLIREGNALPFEGESVIVQSAAEILLDVMVIP